MANLEIKNGKHSIPRKDFTPMVDLGFLLITFFLFTTTMSHSTAMEIQMPYKDKKKQNVETLVKEGTALTILLSNDHRIIYYEGIGNDPNRPPAINTAYFKNNRGIRDIISKKKQSVQSLINQGILNPTDKTTILIKPDSNSTTEDLLNIMDEMAINTIRRYAIVDITPEDRDYIQSITAAGQ